MIAARHASLLLAAVLASACSQILSIEEAHVDPTLSGGSGGSGGSAPSAAGSSTAAGENQNDGGKAGSHQHGGSSGSAGEPSGIGSEAGSADSGGGAPPTGPGLCERYCDQISSACKGKYEQYRTFDQCVLVCKQMDPGAEGDKDTNTVSCRLRQAELAEAEPFVYCKSAGPLGEGKCGSNCISYCSLMQTACTPESTAGNVESSYYESSQACLAACADLPDTASGPTYYSSSADVEPTSFIGNTVFCRTYHLAAALEQDTPDEHCPHAMGGDPCIE